MKHNIDFYLKKMIKRNKIHLSMSTGTGECPRCHKIFKVYTNGILYDHGQRWMIVTGRRRYIKPPCSGSGLTCLSTKKGIMDIDKNELMKHLKTKRKMILDSTGDIYMEDKARLWAESKIQTLDNLINKINNGKFDKPEYSGIDADREMIGDDVDFGLGDIGDK